MGDQCRHILHFAVQGEGDSLMLNIQAHSLNFAELEKLNFQCYLRILTVEVPSLCLRAQNI